MAVVHVVDMVAMGHGHMSAALLVAVVMARVRRVTVGGALVHVTVVSTVDVAVVHVVDMVAVRDGHMSAAFVVLVVVPLMGTVLGGGRHGVLPVRWGRAAARPTATAALPIHRRTGPVPAHAERGPRRPSGRADGKLPDVTTHETVHAPAITQLTRTEDATAAIRRELTDCWAGVINAGGAVVPMDCPLPPVTPATLEPAMERIAAQLSPQRLRLLRATVGGSLAGWLLLRREQHPLVAHCGVVNHVQTHVGFRGLGVGTALMRRAARIAREEMSLERLQLTARDGLGLDAFYRRAGWREVGRWPGALRVAPGDDRDEILMSLEL
ncbi:GNAT superfamily N-acetyltransferase [Streptomyces calvus]